MLKKLMKYDFVWIFKVLVYHTTILLVVAALGRLISPLAPRSMFWSITDGVFLSLTIAAACSLFFTAFMRSATRYINNTYKDESYLTHTLPVTRGQQYTSKVFSSVLVLLVSLVVCLIATAICNSYKNRWEMVKHYLSNPQYRTLILLFVLVVVLQIVCMLLCTLAGATFGYRKGSHKLLHSLLCILLIYVITQGIMVGVIFLISRFDSGVAMLFTTSTRSMMEFLTDPISTRICWILAAEYIVANVALFFLGKRALEKGVNVD